MDNWGWNKDKHYTWYNLGTLKLPGLIGSVMVLTISVMKILKMKMLH
jgi:hypothetical protein